MAEVVTGRRYALQKIRLTQCVWFAGLALALMTLSGCATVLSEGEQQAKRSELDEMADRTIATLLERRPEAAEILEQSVGYAVINMRVTKIPLIGGGGGVGVVRDQRIDARAYTKVSRFEVGGGLGSQKFKVIIFFSDEKLLDRAIAGAWHFEAGAEAVVGDDSREGNIGGASEGYRAFRIGESGAVATVTIRLARAKPYLN